MTAATQTTLPLLTASRLRDARSCQRLHKFKYVDGYRPAVDAETLRFGKLVHVALEQWWKRTGEDRLPAALAAMTAAATAIECDPFEFARARAMVLAYDARWSAEQYETLAVETEFVAPLRNPETGAASRTWALGGKIDAIVRDQHGRVMLVEHKTSSLDLSPGSSYWAQLRLDAQISIYYEGARSLGFDVEGCLYDVLGKVAIRPLKVNQKRKIDETPDEFFQRCAEAYAEEPNRYLARGEVVRLEAEMAEALADIWQLGRSLHENALAKRWPRNVDSCFKFNRPCPFWSACTGEASLDDARFFRRAEATHEELGEANGAT
jgi:hypothetical protein